MNDGFAFTRQSARHLIVKPAAISKPARDFLVSIETGKILRRRNNGDFPIRSPRRFPYGDQLDPIRTGRKLAEVALRVVIRSEIEIVPRFMAEDGLATAPAFAPG